MILLDANVLLYAYDRSSRFHERAREWIQETLSGAEPVGLPWATLLAFLRISTNARAVARPLEVDEACTIVASWLERPQVVRPEPGARHWQILAALLVSGQARGPLVTDAHLAALAIEHGALLATSDRDFARFAGVRTVNPLE